jgi:solute carrier family 25 (mitochondrial adenine nucleotide translocator), member 4/5/6/31
VILHPFEYARSCLASTENYKFDGLWDCIIKTVKKSGISGIYSGLGLSLFATLPYRGVYFGLFDTISSHNSFQHESNSNLRIGTKFLSALFSAMAAYYATHPFDIIRHCLERQSELPRVDWKYFGITDCFVKLTRNEGVAALFKGAFDLIHYLNNTQMFIVLHDKIIVNSLRFWHHHFCT